LFLPKPGRRVEARVRYRDWDGRRRQVQATGNTKAAAERALKKKLADRALFQPPVTGMTPDSPFADLVKYWLADLELEGRVAAGGPALFRAGSIHRCGIGVRRRCSLSLGA
jgi:hypothetical protein